MEYKEIKLHGITLILEGYSDGHQFDVHSIELKDPDKLTELLLDMDRNCDIERLASECVQEIDEDAIYESINEK